MKAVTKILKRIVRIVKIVSLINWLQFWRQYHSDSEILLWIPRISFVYFGTDAFIWDMATIEGLLKRGEKIGVFCGKGIGKYHHKKIFFSISSDYNVYKFDDYTSILAHITRQLEFQNNVVFPKSNESRLWENKAYMHHLFDRADVHTPKTKIIHNLNELVDDQFEFPFLIKAEHSCASEGLYKVSNWADIVALADKADFKNQNTQIIVQELINMRRDLRVILVGEEIVLHYWRINLQKDWRPTSTSYGSQVDFVSFPDRWKKHILKTFRSLNMTTGAFDIAWENDDLSTVPLYLEISPFYQPNPNIEVGKHAYAFYKQKFRLFRSWDAKYVAEVFRIKDKQVNAYLDEHLELSNSSF
jgi:glutathione synthase/RimK-type ligase-like ATP-grasp enzyme